MNYPAKNIANKIIRPFYVFLLVGIAGSEAHITSKHNKLFLIPSLLLPHFQQ
ncbi:MAG: hypothetical protein WA667_18415 [Candidatus Nitrosopolaris sp.]